MKKMFFYLCVLTIFFSVIGRLNVHAKSSENKAKCLDWCSKHKPECAFCSSNMFCGGPKHDIIASFKKGSGNWYACGLSERERASRENERQCRQWCENNERCEHCSSRSGCGKGYKRMGTWDNGGNSWHACEAKNWGTRNKVKCEAWCKNKKYCSHCSSLKFCGPHFNPMKDWDGYGKNFSACKKDGHVNRIWEDYKDRDIYKETRILLLTLGGAKAHRNDLDDGLEWFCEDYIYGTNLARKVKCISSYAAVNTKSSKLSKNIVNLIHKIKAKTKKDPKVIFAAKSMGACKLQHALFKSSLKNYTIDTFFGVDASCYAFLPGTKHGKHWQLKEGLLFHRHKKGTQGGVITLQNFYEDIDNTQTGHVLAFTDQFTGKTNLQGEARYGSEGSKFHYSFDPDNHDSQVNVNEENFNFDPAVMKKIPGKMCSNVHHTHPTRPIDRCPNLRDGIFKYIKMKAQEK